MFKGGQGSLASFCFIFCLFTFFRLEKKGQTSAPFQANRMCLKSQLSVLHFSPKMYFFITAGYGTMALCGLLLHIYLNTSKVYNVYVNRAWK